MIADLYKTENNRERQDEIGIMESAIKDLRACLNEIVRQLIHASDTLREQHFLTLDNFL